MTWNRCPRHYRCRFVLIPARRPYYRINLDNIIPKMFSIQNNASFHNITNVCSFVLMSHSAFSNELISCNEWRKDFPLTRSPNIDYNIYMHHILLKSLFKPSPSIQRVLHSTIYTHARMKPCIALHARTGDDVRQKHINRFQKMYVHWYERLGHRFMQCVLQLNWQNKFVLFVSDSIRSKQEFRRQAKEHDIDVVLSTVQLTTLRMNGGGEHWGNVIGKEELKTQDGLHLLTSLWNFSHLQMALPCCQTDRSPQD